MTTISIETAQAQLVELIEQLQPGLEIIITRDQQPVARLVPACVGRVAGLHPGSMEPAPDTDAPLPDEFSTGKSHRRLGSLKGSVLYMAPDFDAPLEDFKEYME